MRVMTAFFFCSCELDEDVDCLGAEFYSFDDYAPSRFPHEAEPRIYSNGFHKDLPKKLHVRFADDTIQGGKSGNARLVVILSVCLFVCLHVCLTFFLSLSIY